MTYNVKIGEPIIWKEHGVAAYWAVDMVITAPFVRFLAPNRPSPIYAEDLSSSLEEMWGYGEVRIRYHTPGFTLWEYQGELPPEEGLWHHRWFTPERPRGDVAAAIRTVLTDQHIRASLMYGQDYHLLSYAKFLDEKAAAMKKKDAAT